MRGTHLKGRCMIPSNHCQAHYLDYELQPCLQAFSGTDTLKENRVAENYLNVHS